MKRIFSTVSPLLGLVLSGCATTAYHTPTAPVAANYAHASAGGVAVSDAWWRSFGDEGLDALIDAVLDNNNDLAVAGLKVKQARLNAKLAGLDQWPTASGGLSATTGNGASAYAASVSISYEADLWGRLADATRAARWEAEATDQDRQATRLSLIGTACELYWDIAFTRQQIKSGQESLAYAQKVLDLVVVQHEAGVVSSLEQAEAEQSVNAQTSALAALQQQLVAYRGSLTVLLGGEAWPQDKEASSLPMIDPPHIDAGIPARLLSRRPDLRAAEMRLREDLANVDAVRAQLYPPLSLTATGGGASSELGSVLAHPAASLAASLSLPFLDLPRKQLDIKVSQASYDMAVANFRTTLVKALADTDTALSNRTQLAIQGRSLAATLADAQRVKGLYAIQYRAGAVPLRTWLDAQESFRQARLNLDSNRLQQLIATSALYQALGGGA
jgi:NodT family efflux transporter outer membrane factor (OMF) lipoprotein